MKTLRINNPRFGNFLNSPEGDHAVILALPKRQVGQLIGVLADALAQAPADSQVLPVPFYGKLEQHIEEWRPVLEVPAPSSPSTTCDDPEDD